MRLRRTYAPTNHVANLAMRAFYEFLAALRVAEAPLYRNGNFAVILTEC